MATITEFIHQNYDIAFRGKDVDPANLEPVREFLLAERHTHQGHGLMHVLFIDTFAKSEEDIVLVEGTPSMRRISKTECYQSVYIDREDLHIAGWDLGTFPQMGYPDFEPEQSRIIIKKFLDAKSSSDVEEAPEQLYSSIKKDMRKARLYLRSGELESIDKVTFSKRQESLLETLQNTDKYVHKFLIAGAAHLIEREGESDPTFSFDSFIRSLEERSVVVLYPKEERALEIGAFAIALVESIGQRIRGELELEKLEELSRKLNPS